MDYIKELEQTIEERIESIKDFQMYRDEIKKKQGLPLETLYEWEIETIKEDAMINELTDLLAYMNESFQ